MTLSVGIIGEPGVGKTTVMRAVLDEIRLDPERLGAARWMRSDAEKLIVMGNYGGHTFDGTDRLSMSCYADLERAAGYFADQLPGYAILWEGDRMTRQRWLDALVQHGYELVVFHVTAEAGAAQARRDSRGSNQNPSWIAGRRTTSARLGLRSNATDVDLSDDLAAEELARVIRNRVLP